MSQWALSHREARMVERLIDAVVAPAGDLPPVRRTDAVAAFGAQLAAGPALNRLGLLAALHVAELAPLALGHRAPLRRLAPGERRAVLARLEVAGSAGLVLRGLSALAKLAYYGDDGVARRLGYEPDAVVARGRALRRAEARW